MKGVLAPLSALQAGRRLRKLSAAWLVASSSLGMDNSIGDGGGLSLPPSSGGHISSHHPHRGDSAAEAAAQLRDAAGFYPEYLSRVRSPEAVRALTYTISAVLLSGGPAPRLGIAAKALVAYVLAVGGENAVLAAHAAYVAHRYGATAAQLAAALSLRSLLRMHRVYASARSAAAAAAETGGSATAGGEAGGGGSVRRLGGVGALVVTLAPSLLASAVAAAARVAAAAARAVVAVVAVAAVAVAVAAAVGSMWGAAGATACVVCWMNLVGWAVARILLLLASRCCLAKRKPQHCLPRTRRPRRRGTRQGGAALRERPSVELWAAAA